MSKIDQLIKSYKNYIETPWRDDAAAPQRVIFCVFNEADELVLRHNIDEFEIVTKQAKHDWNLFDVTNSFPEWLSKLKYAQTYFKDQRTFPTILDKDYPKYIKHIFSEFINNVEPDENTVIAVKGVGTLFGMIKVKDIVDIMAPMIKGRLLIFFPGSYDGNNYRLLDGYDGWNYLAVPITADKNF